MRTFRPVFSNRFVQQMIELQPGIRERAGDVFKIRERDNHYNSFKFKKLKTKAPNVYLIRITETGAGYRAVGYAKGDILEWTWIGPHNAYLKFIKNL